MLCAEVDVMTRLIVSLVAAGLGVASMLAGLGVDAWLHAQDETLAAREGIFTLTNPGHALLAAGVALACGGVFSALHAAWGMAGAHGALGLPVARHATLAAAGAASLAAVVFALAVSSSGHAHEDAAPHAHDAVAHTHDVASTAVQASTFEGAAPTQALESLMQAPADGIDHAHADAASGPGDAGATTDGTSHGHASANDGDAAPGGRVETEHRHRTAKPTAEEIACLRDLTAQGKAATARFEDYAVAAAEGYRDPGLRPDGQPRTHFGNPAYRRDGATFDLANPEVLIYVPAADGSKRFVGAMYTAPVGQGPAPCGNATFWHTHNQCINPETRAMEPEAADHTCPAGWDVREGRVEMIHLWFAPRGRRG
jgi:hypothetical protein